MFAGLIYLIFSSRPLRGATGMFEARAKDLLLSFHVPFAFRDKIPRARFPASWEARPDLGGAHGFTERDRSGRMQSARSSTASWMLGELVRFRAKKAWGVDCQTLISRPTTTLHSVMVYVVASPSWCAFTGTAQRGAGSSQLRSGSSAP